MWTLGQFGVSEDETSGLYQLERQPSGGGWRKLHVTFSDCAKQPLAMKDLGSGRQIAHSKSQRFNAIHRSG